MADIADSRGTIAASATPKKQDGALEQQHLVIVSAKSGSVNSAAEGIRDPSSVGTLVCWTSAAGNIDAADALSPVASRRNGASPYLCAPGEGGPVVGVGPMRSVPAAVVAEAVVEVPASPAAEPVQHLDGLDFVLTVCCLWAVLYFLICFPTFSKPPGVQPSISGGLRGTHRKFCGLNPYFNVCSDTTRCNCVRNNLPED